jgi:hypothetical protein
LLDSNFEKVAQTIADTVNNATPVLSKKRKEFSKVKAVLSGMEFPELEAKLSRLRIRKSELEDIIADSASSCSEKLDSGIIVDIFRYST